MPSNHRPAAVAGMFYPGDAGTLRAEIARQLSAAPPSGELRPPKLIVVPHAGYVYSGVVAAHAYALLAPWRGRVTRVVLLGPTHRVPVRGLAVPSAAAFDTPLGAVPVDRAAIDRLADLPQVVESDHAHAQEHSLEVQLPFLQTVLGNFTLVPLAVGRATPQEVAQVLERLWGGEDTLVVVSSDLSHYLASDDARRLDSATVARILALEPGIDHDEACGATPLNGALRVARARGMQPQLLDLRNSGDTAGDPSRVVGYGSIAFREALGPALLARARNAIAARLGLPTIDEPGHPELHGPAASFVTLHRNGELRGCIGRLEAGPHPLDEDVRRNAGRAAFEDPRFPPLRAHEWRGLAVEVSLLGALEPLAVQSEAEALRVLQPLEDGVMFEWRGRRSTFLPQVWEQLPDARAFLAALRRKAGLPEDFWHADARLWRYAVRKFADDEALA